MTARLLKMAMASTLIGAATWFLWLWQIHRGAAVVGSLVLLLSIPIILGIEFLAIMIQGRVAGEVSTSSGGEALGAWLHECLAAALVFCWWQPFRSNQMPDTATQGQGDEPDGCSVILVHGFLCNRGIWRRWFRRLSDAGIPFVAPNLEPVFGSIDAYVRAIDAAARKASKNFRRPIVVVCHSMGGLAVRAWLSTLPTDNPVRRVVTIGTPHQGTWLGRLGFTPNARQMRIGSAWLRQLRAAEDPFVSTKFTCWYSNCDNIVFPPEVAILQGADNRLVRGVAHVELALHPLVIEGSLEIIRSAQLAESSERPLYPPSPSKDFDPDSVR